MHSVAGEQRGHKHHFEHGNSLGRDLAKSAMQVLHI